MALVLMTKTRQRLAIDEFIKNYNSDAAPFEWTKSQVHQVGVTKNINNLRN